MRALGGGLGPHVVIECSGAEAAMANGLEVVRRGGRYVQIGQTGDRVRVPLALVSFKELRLSGGFASTPASWRRAIELLAAGRVDLEALVSRVAPLTAWEEVFALHRARRGDQVRARPERRVSASGEAPGGASRPAPPAGLELVTVGRIGIDLYPRQLGRRLRDVESFARSLGGSPTNVAVGAARLGRRSAVVTKVGDDEFGAYARAALERFGVWSGWVGTDPRLRTPLAFAEIHPPDDFPLLFYREPAAPDMRLTAADLDPAAVAGVPLLWVTGGGLAAEPSRATTLAAVAARSRGEGRVVLDLDHRPSLWRSRAEARAVAQEALAHADVVVGNEQEFEVATGLTDPAAIADELLAGGAELVVVKRGPRGVVGADRDGRVALAPVPVEVLCGLGAGDAFGAALCHGLLAGWELERMLAFAGAAGALVASRLACADAMPRADEVDDLLARHAATR